MLITHYYFIPLIIKGKGKRLYFNVLYLERLNPCSKWADLNCGEDEKMVSLIVSEIMCAINFSDWLTSYMHLISSQINFTINTITYLEHGFLRHNQKCPTSFGHKCRPRLTSNKTS